MRLLRVLDLALVGARRVGEVLVAVKVADLLARAVDRLVREVDRVGAHVGDVPAFVEPLGDAHRTGGREPQLPSGFLLQGGRGERRLRALGECPRLDRRDLVADLAQALDEGLGVGLGEVDDRVASAGAVGDVARRGVEVAAARHLLAVELDERGGEAGAVAVVGRRELALEVPVLGRPERHPGPLPLHHQAGGDALHPAGRQAGHHLLPQDGRHLVADEPVEHASALLGLDELHVEVAPVLDGGFDRLPRDLVEHHPAHRYVGVEHLEDVPRDRLAFAVLVGREVQLARIGDRGLELLDHVLFLLGHDVDRLELVLDVDPQTTGVGALVLLRHLAGVTGQVADVPDARLARRSPCRDSPRSCGPSPEIRRSQAVWARAKSS